MENATLADAIDVTVLVTARNFENRYLKESASGQHDKRMMQISSKAQYESWRSGASREAEAALDRMVPVG